MTREELKEYVPHREPMLLVDEVDINPDGTVTARYRVRGDEPFLNGHFPGNPIVPGVILCEIMAQSCTMLVKEHIKGKITLFSGMDNVRFKQKVVPGDTLQFEVELTEPLRRGMASMQGKAFVGGKLVCEASLMAQIIKNE
jgi:beta-hydroxyacyl-ACP dehydratase FabZ